MKAVAIIFALLLLAVSARADDPVPAELQDVGVDERLGDSLPLDLTFINESGKTVKLRDCLMPGKPAVLQLGYFGCPMLCDTVSQGLVRSMRELDLNIGQDFTAIYVSFDPKETPSQGYLKKKSYVQQYQRGGAGAGWHFLVGDDASIEKLSAAVGYKFKWLQAAKQFSHPAVLMVLSPDGRVMRYLYGVEYPQATLRLSLVEASEGKVGSTLDRILMLCFQYSPTKGRYTLAAMGLMRLAGAATVIVLATVLIRQYLKERRQQPAS